MKVQITNICFKSNTGCKINLNDLHVMESILFNGTRTKYTPNKFPGLIVYLSKTTCLLFGSGYFSLCGGKAVENGVESRDELYLLLNKHGYEPIIDDVLLTNIC